MDKKIVQIDLVKEFFQQNPNRPIEHPEVVDWVVAEYQKRTGKVFRDPDRAIRQLAQTGFLVKVRKGCYLHDPTWIQNKELNLFTESQKQQILERDNYRCVICGRGLKDGVELHIDHIKPRALGGEATLENGQTLCGQHNYLKKTNQQTETGKRMFIRLYELASKDENESLINFCKDVLKIYEKHGINGHIQWNKPNEE